MWFNLFVFILLISTGYGYDSPEEVEVGRLVGYYRPECIDSRNDCAKNQLCYKGKCYDGKGTGYGPPLCRDEPKRNCLCHDGDNVCKRYKWVGNTRIKQYCLITNTGVRNSCIPDTRAEMDVGDSPEEVEVGATCKTTTGSGRCGNQGGELYNCGQGWYCTHSNRCSPYAYVSMVGYQDLLSNGNCEVKSDEESVGFGTSKIKTQENFWDIGYKSIAIFGFGLVTGSGLVALVLMNRKDPMKVSLLEDQEI